MLRTLEDVIKSMKNREISPGSEIEAMHRLLAAHRERDINLAAFIELAPGENQEPIDYYSLPLGGATIAVKDNIDTADLGCSAGSLALSEVAVSQDAFLVRKIRAAGGVVAGKTNLSEWANFRSTRSMSGWSSAGGQCRNPFVMDRSPCGSSSGSAVAVAGGYVSAAIGTETDGSIICPAATNGIVGLKPTMGRVSRGGIVPIAESQDTAGPMANTVRDAALLLKAIEGEDPMDPATADRRRDTSAELFSDMGMKDLAPLRLGYFEGGDGFISTVKSEFHVALSLLEEAGAELRNIGSIPQLKEIHDAEFQVLLCEFRDDIESYFEKYRRNGSFSSLNELIVYNIGNRGSVMPYFGQELFYMASDTKGRRDKRYAPAKERCQTLAVKEGLELMFDEYRLDALLMPSNNPAWLIDPLLGDYGTGGSSTLAAVSGWPSLTVPMTRIYSLPVGLTIVGRPWSESRILGIGEYFERKRGVLKPAEFTKSLNFEGVKRY